MAEQFDRMNWNDVVSGKIEIVQDANTPKGEAHHEGAKVHVHPDTYRDFIKSGGHLGEGDHIPTHRGAPPVPKKIAPAKPIGS